MPGFDGTGPQGRGPMTGNAGGYCLINIPDKPNEPRTGFAGMAGKIVTMANDRCDEDLFGLQTRLREIQSALQAMKSRLAEIEAGSRKS
ncbi:MAG: DUF5320 domain-containing protein [Candidatus Aminicenantes bacterium]|nr:DUF5320 domain-containing protein [Candidatus Aminicenantes bacterium]